MPTLRAILGQERAVAILRRQVASGKLPHALLFAGPNGVGKATSARALARALNCATPADGDACGAAGSMCDPCARIEAGIHPDVVTIVPGGAGNMISIDEIRRLAETLGFAPHEGAARVVILAESDRLNPQASNAFLKTLEEPPARTHFVLTSAAPDRLLITIRSRCQTVRFGPLSNDAVASLLVGAGLDEARARAVAPLAGGSAARAAELAEGDALERRRARARALREAVRGGWRAGADAASELAQAKEDVLPTLELLALWYRDAAALAAGVAADRLTHQDELEDLRVETARGVASSARRAAAVLDAHGAIVAFANPQLAIENLILTLREDPSP